MNNTQLLLIDLSSIAHAIFHVSGNEPDPSFISNQILVKVRQLASQHPHAAICLDAGRSFRHDLEPTYKANRDTENRAVIKHQIDVACDELRKDGFPVWAVKGYEADDLIATATREVLAMSDEITVLIASADKDLLQLVNGRVQRKNTHPQSNGAIEGPAEVRERFGVEPSQLLDWLCLVGDSSDNVKGAEGIGPKTATELLKLHGSIEGIYQAMSNGVVPGLTPAKRTAMQQFRERWPLVKSLIELKTDAPIPIAEIGVEREARPMEPETSMDEMREMLPTVGEPSELMRELTDAQAADAASAAMGKVAERIKENGTKADGAVQAYREAVASIPVRAELVPRDYSQELEPRTIAEAKQLAQWMFESRLFGAYGTPQAVLSTVLAGRELGMPAMAALRAFHIIDGKPQLSAGAIVSLVLKSGKAKYFRCTERTDTRATYCTQRGDDPELCLSYTIDEGKTAWPKDEAAWKKSGWGRNPADMLVARASSKLARLVYPDVVSGLYAPEEMD